MTDACMRTPAAAQYLGISVELFAKPKPSNRHWYAYDVLLDGQTIIAGSRDPEHDLARALLPQLAQNGRASSSAECLLSGVKRT